MGKPFFPVPGTGAGDKGEVLEFLIQGSINRYWWPERGTKKD